jgi:hypothetical protein
MSRSREAGRRTFRALSVRNYRLYFTGQVISVSGTWMQMVAQTYLILFPLHGTGVDVAIAAGLQFLPMLFFGPFGGLIADRLDKRKVLYAPSRRPASWPSPWGCWSSRTPSRCGRSSCWPRFSGWSTCSTTRPGRPSSPRWWGGPAPQCREPQQRGHELGPRDRAGHRRRAHPDRGRGDLLHGQRRLLHGGHRRPVADAGVGALLASRAWAGPKGQVREGLRYVWATPDLRSRSSPWPSSASSPSTSRSPCRSWPRSPSRRGRPLQRVPGRHGRRGRGGRPLHRPPQQSLHAASGGDRRLLRRHDRGRGAGMPTTLVAIILLVPMGAASISFIATNNATLQLRADPAMRGRVMSLNAIAFLGSTPIGAPLLGYISDVSNPRVALIGGRSGHVAGQRPPLLPGHPAACAPSAATRRRGVVVADESSNVVPLPLGDDVGRRHGARVRSPAMSPGVDAAHDRRRAGSFGDDAEQYDRVRPEYPVRADRHAHGRTAPTVLDVGAARGSPPASSSPAAADVLGLEPDLRMAAVARRSGVTVESGTIEEWEAGERRFDLLTAGQAWHWVDPLTGARPRRRRSSARADGSACSGTRPAPIPRSAPSSRRHTPGTPRSSGRASVLMGQRDPSLYESGAERCAGDRAFE